MGRPPCRADTAEAIGHKSAWNAGSRRIEVFAYKKSIAKFVYEKRNFQYSSAHHALCDAEARAFLAFGLPKAKVRVIPNGVYVPPLSHPPKDGSTFRLLYLGRIHHKKGLDLLLPALSLVPRELLENWDLDIVGWGDAAFIDEMKKLSSSLSLQGKVHFCGPRYGEEKEEMYRKADAFILPSRSEGLPMAVLEAWSHGLPVLMTKECNLPEGFSAAAALPLPLEAEGMARTLTEFFSMSREQRRNLGVNGYDLVRKTFSWQQIGNRLIELYGEISVGA